MPHAPYRLGSLFAAALLATTALMPAKAQSAPADAAAHFADHLGYKLTVISNGSHDGFNTRLDLTLPKTGLPKGEWALYFGSVSPLDLVGDSAFDLTHINGDNYKLTPKAATTEKT